MATDICNVQMTGRLTKDLSATQLKNGDTIINFSIAVDESYKRKQDEDWTEKTSFYNASLFTKNPDRYLKLLSIGDKVFVSGGMTMEQWETKEGEKKQGVKLKPQILTLVEKNKRSGESSNGTKTRVKSSPNPEESFDGGMPLEDDEIPF